MIGDNEACGAGGGPLDDGHKPDCPVMEFRRTVVELERDALRDMSRRDEGEHEDPEIHSLQAKEGSDVREACGLCGNAITAPHVAYCPYSI